MDIFHSLDLDAWINDPPSSSEEEAVEAVEMSQANYDDYYSPTKERRKEMTSEEIEKVRFKFFYCFNLLALLLAMIWYLKPVVLLC